MSKKNVFKKIKLTEHPNPKAVWWITLLEDEDMLVAKFTERWGVAPRFYSHVKGHNTLIRLGPVPD